MAFKKKVTRKAAPKRVVKKAAPKRVTKKAAPKQTGASVKKLDKLVQAKPVGKRKSSSGKVYYEYRANRSDKGVMMGLPTEKNEKIQLKRLRQIGAKSTSTLVKKVVSIIARNYVDGGYSSLESYFNEIQQNGCVSGMISELIYYNDTVAFWKRYKKDIMNILIVTMSDLGTESPAKVFGKNWDQDDPFATDTANQNLLAWFGFEQTAYDLANNLF